MTTFWIFVLIFCIVTIIYQIMRIVAQVQAKRYVKNNPDKLDMWLHKPVNSCSRRTYTNGDDDDFDDDDDKCPIESFFDGDDD